MKTIAVIALAVLVASSSARARGQSADVQQVAFIVRVPMVDALDDPTTRSPSSAAASYAEMARSLARWSREPLSEIPVALAVSPTLCDELTELDPPTGRGLLGQLRKLSARADVLTVPYSDVWLPFLDREDVREQLTMGAEALERCLGKAPSDVLFAHVLYTGEAEPVDDVDRDAIAAARDLGIGTVVADGPTQTPVRSDVELVPWTPDPPEVGDDGTIAAEPATARIAAIVDAFGESPRAMSSAEAVAASDVIRKVAIGELADDAPRVSVAYPSDRTIDVRSRDAVANAVGAVDDLASILERDSPLRVRLNTAFARAMAQTSVDEHRNIGLGEHRRFGRDACARIVRYVRSELAKIRLTQGSVTFTSRRGSVPVTVENGASYPVKIRLTLRSPKLEFPEFHPTGFPEGASVVRTVAPPGDTITFEALANSSGTFPLTVVLGSREVTLDRTEITVRSTAANLPVLILTIGGALFLVVVYGRRLGRRRREPA